MNMSKRAAEQREAQSTASIWQRTRLVLILGALSTFGALSIDMYLPALPQLARDFGASASSIQLTLSACLIGLALGQVVAGPLSDTYGRRRPLLIGVSAYAAASLACAVAPSVLLLTIFRCVQGLAGAAGIVIARAIVRDLYAGAAAARFFSWLMVVSGLAPILAPILGGQVLQVTSWRSVFLVLFVIGLLLLVLAALGLTETLPTEVRQTGGLRATRTTFRRLLADSAFVGYAGAGGFAFAALFAYISGSSFVLQEIYGVSPQGYSIIFGINAFGLMAASQVNGWLVCRVSPQRLLIGGLTAMACGGAAQLAVIAVGSLGLGGVTIALSLVVVSLGFVMPNATTLALSGHPRTAGSASALLGVLQFAVGAAAAPLVGLGSRSAVPMAIVIAVCGVSALAVGVLIAQRAAVEPLAN
jgi:DHA1 family bicyclomycin/chloramphenicol resistance-like MFS transporter